MNEQLLERLKHCQTLPSLPTIALQVLDLAQRSDADIAEIARIISRDPALSTKILRTVNSSFYARSQNVGTISQALVILGLQSVKTLVLGFSLVSNLSKLRGKGFDHVAFWKHSIYSATAAKAIATRIGLVQQEESFLAALLMDLGMLVLDQVLGEAYSEIHAKTTSHEELAGSERETLGMTHADVGGYLTSQWKLPPLLTTPIQHHAAPEAVADPALRKMTEVVWLAGRCADVFVDSAAAPAIAAVRKFCQSSYSMSEADCDALLEQIGQRSREVASLFEMNLGPSQQYDQILKKANEALVELTLQSQKTATQLQETAKTLVQQNQQLKHQASTDALTGLSNRIAFDQFLDAQFALTRSRKQSLALIMIDVDNFKAINDKHGHPAGDEILRALGKLLQRVRRPQDLSARFGGEEFCLLMPEVGRAAAAAVAERIRQAIASHPIPTTAVAVPLTVSIGVACAEAGNTLPTAALLLKSTDMALYAAKHAGKNCVKVFTGPKSSAAA